MGQKYSCRNRRDLPDLQKYLTVTDQKSKPKYQMLQDFEVAVALHPFKANSPKQLSFNRGDTLEVMNRNDKVWWLARYPGHADAGYIPGSYVALTTSLKSQKWFFGEMTREESEQILMSRLNSPGAFLMRKSLRIKSYVLSVRMLTDVRHFKINQTHDGRFEMAGYHFHELSDLVVFYMNAINSGLPQTIPKYPCIRAPPTMQGLSKEAKDEWKKTLVEKMRYIKKLRHGSFVHVWMSKGVFVCVFGP